MANRALTRLEETLMSFEDTAGHHLSEARFLLKAYRSGREDERDMLLDEIEDLKEERTRGVARSPRTATTRVRPLNPRWTPWQASGTTRLTRMTTNLTRMRSVRYHMLGPLQ